MEPKALVNLAHNLLDDSYALLNMIGADNDSSVRAQMKWSNANSMIDKQSTQPPKTWNTKLKSFCWS